MLTSDEVYVKEGKVQTLKNRLPHMELNFQQISSKYSINK